MWGSDAASEEVASSARLSTIAGMDVRVESTELRLPRAQPRVLRQEVLEALRSDILSGRTKPGSRLLEADIAQRMGVSRAPVREAIRQLEQEGLVEFFPHRGAVVVGRGVAVGHEMRRSGLRLTVHDPPADDVNGAAG